MFYIFALFSIFIHNNSLYRSFGFTTTRPIIIGFILFSDALAPMDAIVKLLMNILSRKFEFEADKFALDLGFKEDLAKSLIKLQVQNLSSMDADWMYASYHYSHPILAERLQALGWTSGTEKVVGNDKLQVDGENVKATGREL
jgi:STE24 endopeptidase